MTGERDTVDVSVGRVENLILSPSWDPSYERHATNDGRLTVVLDRRPPTVRNPPAPPGGLRPPSAFSHEWFRYTERPMPFETRPKPGHRSWFLKSGSFATAYGWQLPDPRDPGGRAGCFSAIAPPPHVLFTAREWAKNAVLKRASQVKWDLSVSAVELKETMALTRDLARDIANTYRRYRNTGGLENAPDNLLNAIDNAARRADRRGSGNWATELFKQPTFSGLGRAGRAAMERFRDRWMQYQFGIRPTVGELQDACSYLSSLGDEAAPAVILRAGKSVPFRRDVNLDQGTLFRTVARVSGNVGVHYSLACRYSALGNSAFTALGLNRPLVTAWEATRLSWMVDYVVDVGSWLEAGYARDNVVFSSGTVSTLWTGASTPLRVINLDDASEWVREFSPRYLLEGGRFEREVLTALPLPGIIPEIKSLTGIRQALNSIFAMTNVVKGKPRGF